MAKWNYKNKDFSDEDIPQDAHGFIYVIVAYIGNAKKFYVGKKKFYQELNVKKGKKELAAMKDKRGSKKKLVRKLKYANYTGSNKELNEHIKNGIKIEKHILKICFSKTELTYQETRYLFKLDVLEKDCYFNDNILGKFYKHKLKQSKDGKETV